MEPGYFCTHRTFELRLVPGSHYKNALGEGRQIPGYYSRQDKVYCRDCFTSLPIEFLTSLDKSDYVETWIRCFSALVRMKKLKDWRVSKGKDEITDLCLASAGYETVKKISVMVYPPSPKKLEDLMYEVISTIIKRNVH